jgi:hypothetical protein
MTTAAEAEPEQSAAGEHPLAHLQATPEERARILAAGQPFDAEAWLRNAVPATPEELADLEEFLKMREEMRAHSLRRGEEFLAEFGR